ncbi:MAG: efflux RND transporter periplasmic adaptor subunit [Planctomycetota bacterium]
MLRATAVLVVCALAAACSGGTDAAQGPKAGAAKRREPVRVRVAPVEQREMVAKLQTTTTVHSEKEIQLYPRASGLVTEVFVQPGDTVEVGQELAAVDDREARALVADARVAIAEAKDAIARAEVAMREAEARVGQTKLEWEQAQRDYERNEKASLISQQALEALRTARDTRANEHETAKLGRDRSVIEARSSATALERAQLSLARAELELSYTRIQAPIAGIVANAGVRVGGTVGRGVSVLETAGAAFVITDLDDLHVEFHRPQRELAWFLGATAADATSRAPTNPGRTLEVHATAEALPGMTFRGTIERISPAIDPQSGSFAVHAHIEPSAAVEDGGLHETSHTHTHAPSPGQTPGHTPGPTNGHALQRARLLPGMLVRLEIVTDRHPNALVVPKRCLRREGEATLIFTVRDGRARRVEVREGFADDTSCEVTPLDANALAAGDLVVVVGNRELEDGSEVAIEELPQAVGSAAVPPAPASSESQGQ